MNFIEKLKKEQKEYTKKLRKESALKRHKNNPFSEKTKIKIGLSNKGSNSGNWKGDNAKYNAIHMWVNKWKSKPDYCESCGIKTNKLEASNIDHKYRRVLDDYIYLCSNATRKKIRM